jgi:hypothetical protein
VSTDARTVGTLQDLKIDVKLKLSALWIVLMFCYTYAGILGFYAPGNLAELVAGEIAGIRMTQELLLGSAVLMVVPSAMVFLSLALHARANRWVNVVTGAVYMVVLGGTLLTGRNPAYYVLYAVVKAACIALILWHAWKWPRTDA